MHPWLRQLPAGRGAKYDVAYKLVATVLAGMTAWGLFELGRGSIFIMSANRAAAAKQVSPHIPKCCCVDFNLIV